MKVTALVVTFIVLFCNLKVVPQTRLRFSGCITHELMGWPIPLKQIGAEFSLIYRHQTS